MTTEGFNDNLSVSNAAHGEGERPVAFPHEAAAQLHEAQPRQLPQAETQAGGDVLPTAGQPGVQVVVAEDNVVKLSAGTSIEKIEIDGDNLVLVQPDGTRIVIEHAALHVPTFVIDDVEIPQEALVAALEASNINVAAGPDGALTASASGSASAGGNFSEAVPGIGDAGPAIDLLPATALEFGTLDEEILLPAFVNESPSISLDGSTSGGAGGIAVSDQLVYESNLPSGSAMSSSFVVRFFESEPSQGAAGELATATGAFTLSDPNGLSDIASITINGKAFALTGLAGATVEGEYGTLTIVSFNAATGEATYSYTLTTAYHSAEGGNGANTEQDRDIFSLIVRDKSGLSASASLRIDIVDDTPEIRGETQQKLPSVGVDETVFASDATVHAAAFFQGLSVVYGADGAHAEIPESYVLTLSAVEGKNSIGTGLFALDNSKDGGKGEEIILSQGADGVISGKVGDTVYFTIAVENGEVTLDQKDGMAIWHGNAADPDDHASLDLSNGALTLSVTVTDGDGDTDSREVDLSHGVFTFNDDGPKVVVEANADFSITHDESLLWQSDADDVLFTSIFDGVANPGQDPQSPKLLPLPWFPHLPLGYAQSTTSPFSTDIDYGADGAAAKNAKVFSLALFGGDGKETSAPIDSGLETTDGHPIFLFKEGDLIVGRYDGSDSGNEITNGGQAPDPAAFAIHIDPNTGIMSMVQYVSLSNDDPNHSDDEVSLAQAVGGSLQAVVTVTDGDGDTGSASVNIGGSIVFQDDGPEILYVEIPKRFEVTADETIGNQHSSNDTGALSVFDGVADKGSDPDRGGTPLAYAQSSKAALGDLTPYFGVDGPAETGSVVFSLGLKGHDGKDSGLKTTEKQPILLYEENGLIVGRVGGEEGDAAFAVAIDPANGKVSVVEYLSLWHPVGTNADDQVSLDSNTLFATVTIKDGDGDTDSVSADISGRIRFNDDGPSFTVGGSATTEEREALALNLDETIAPAELIPDNYNIFESHDNNGVVDNAASEATLTIDAASQAQIGQLKTGAGVLADLFTTSQVNYGADGEAAQNPLTRKLDLVLTGKPGNGFETNLVVTAIGDLAGTSIAHRTVWLSVENGQVIGRIGHDTSGSADDYVAFRISLTDANDPDVAKLIVDQFLPIDHDASEPFGSWSPEQVSEFDEQISLLLADPKQGVGLELTVTAKDGDGDTVSHSATVSLVGGGNSFVSFDDDGPTVSNASGSMTLDDEGLQNPLSAGIEDGPGDAFGKSTEVSGRLPFDAGSDGLKQIEIENAVVAYTKDNEVTQFKAIWIDGEGVGHERDVTLEWTQNGIGGTLKGTALGAGADDPFDVFTLTVDANGVYTLVMQAPLAHPLTDDATGLALEDNLRLKFDYRVTDGDDDIARAALTVDINDDSPERGADVGAAVTEGDIVAGAGGSPATTTFNFNGVAANQPVSSSLGPHLTANESTKGAGVAYGTAFGNQGKSIIITATDDDQPFVVQQMNIGVAGPNHAMTVWLYGYDADGIVVAKQSITVPGPTSVGVALTSLFTAEDGPLGFAGKEIVKLEIVSPRPDHDVVQIDNLVVGIGHATPGEITPAETTIDLSTAAAFGADGQNAAGGFQLKQVHETLAGVTSGTQQVTIETVGDEQTGYKLIGYTGANSDDPVFTLEIVDGKAVFKLYHPVDHTQNQDVNLDFGKYIVAVDGDGDAVTLGHVTVTVEAPPQVEDTPPSAQEVTIRVSEEGLPHGIADSKSAPGAEDTGNAASAQGSIQAHDADGDTLTVTFTSTPSGLKSGGHPLVWSGSDSDTLIGKVGDKTIVTLQVDDTGNVTATLSGPLDQAHAGEDELSFDVDVNVSAGSASTSTKVTVVVEDDAPENFAATPMHIVNDADAEGSGALHFFDHIGADGGKVVFNVENGTTLTSNGVEVTSCGETVKLYLDDDGTTLLAKTGVKHNGTGGTLIFEVHLHPDATDEAKDFYTVEFHQTLDDGSYGSMADFKNNSSEIFKTPTDKELLFSAASRNGSDYEMESVNPSENSIGVSKGQSINDDDILRIDFAKDVEIDKKNYFSYSEHYSVSSVAFSLAKVKDGSDSGIEVWVRIYDAPDNDPGGKDTGTHWDSLSSDRASQGEITGIMVGTEFRALSDLTSDGHGGYLITGLTAGSKITVFGDAGFGRIEIENPSKDAFDDVSHLKGGNFGIIDVSYTKVTDPIELNFDLKATDKDGDTASGTLAIETAAASSTITGTDGPDTLVGGSHAEKLIGGAGDDWLTGGDGDDILLGGSGHNTLTGGAGNDTFVIDAGALQKMPELADMIMDYRNEPGAGGEHDVVDLSSLLQGISSAEITSHVQVLEGGSGAADQLQVSVNGHADAFVTVAVLDANAGVKILYNDDHKEAVIPHS